jgi:hypothetical protein
MEVERFSSRFGALAERLEQLDADQAALAATLEQDAAPSLKELVSLVALARRVAGAPALSAQALGSSAWDDREQEITNLICTGEQYASLRIKLAPTYGEAAWETDLAGARLQLGKLPATFSPEAFARLSLLVEKLPRLRSEADALARSMGRDLLRPSPISSASCAWANVWWPRRKPAQMPSRPTCGIMALSARAT